MILINAHTREDLFEVSGRESAKIFETGQEDNIRFEAPVTYHLRVQKSTQDLIVTGSASTTVSLECARCLCSFQKKIEIEDILYAYKLHDVQNDIDLTPHIREEFLLRLPIMPLCSENCRGICPDCGKKLNENTCRCNKAVKPSASDILDDLDLK